MKFRNGIRDGMASVGAVALCLALTGCGVSEKQLNETEARLTALSERGVADSVLSEAKVHIFNARTANKLGDGGKAKKEAGAAEAIIESQESALAARNEKLKPVVGSTRDELSSRSAELTGLHKKAADSILAIADTLIARAWYAQAQEELSVLKSLLPGLVEAEGTAEKTRARVLGTWVRSETEGRARHRTRYVFKSDGNFTWVEEKKGQSTEFLKEDWKFISSGSFALKGDTVHLFVEREQCPRQVYWNYRTVDGKRKWVKEESATYDSTITGGAKDQYMTYEYMRKHLKKT